MLVTLGGVRQILVITANRVVGLTPEKAGCSGNTGGRRTWASTSHSRCFSANDRVFVSAGYGQGAAAIEVTRAGDQFRVKEIWRNTRMKNKFTSSLLHAGYIYGLDEAILACMDAATGELKWKGGRYGYGQVMLAGDHLVVLTESGEVVLVKATPERHIELASFPAIEGKTWNHPVIANGRLLVRNLQEMAAFDISQP